MTAAAAPTLQRIPVKPFYFNTSAHLPRITPYKASNLAELLDALRECPEDSIFHHTCQYFMRNPGLEYTNDFAQWAGESLGERRFIDAAKRAARFVLERMTAGGALHHSWRLGLTSLPAVLDDYAAMCRAARARSSRRIPSG